MWSHQWRLHMSRGGRRYQMWQVHAWSLGIRCQWSGKYITMCFCRSIGAFTFLCYICSQKNFYMDVNWFLMYLLSFIFKNNLYFDNFCRILARITRLVAPSVIVVFPQILHSVIKRPDNVNANLESEDKNVMFVNKDFMT